ncbi:hypothetical protein I541_5544 [Mycobacteroides abscessus]|nr:hypothetical protein I541_5544 [Mycobacteroides abscessus]
MDILASRHLIPLPALLRGLQWTNDDYELAEELWTDVHTVRVRRNNLTARRTHLARRSRGRPIHPMNAVEVLEFERIWWKQPGIYL